MNTTFLYTLNCPLTGEIRYLGKSDNPFKRFKAHLSQAVRGKTYKNNWILGLQAQELKPWMELLDEVPIAEWQFWEQEYIRVFSAINVRLTNGTAGGEGLVGLKFSAQHRANLSASKRGENHHFFGKTLTAEHRARIGLAGIGRKPMAGKRHSPETREKMRLAHLGEKNSNFGKPSKLRGKPLPLVTVEKIRVAQLGALNHNFDKTASEHTREKMRASQQRRRVLEVAK